MVTARPDPDGHPKRFVNEREEREVEGRVVFPFFSAFASLCSRPPCGGRPRPGGEGGSVGGWWVRRGGEDQSDASVKKIKNGELSRDTGSLEASSEDLLHLRIVGDPWWSAKDGSKREREEGRESIDGLRGRVGGGCFE